MLEERLQEPASELARQPLDAPPRSCCQHLQAVQWRRRQDQTCCCSALALHRCFGSAEPRIRLRPVLLAPSSSKAPLRARQAVRLAL